MVMIPGSHLSCTATSGCSGAIGGAAIARFDGERFHHEILDDGGLCKWDDFDLPQLVQTCCDSDFEEFHQVASPEREDRGTGISRGARSGNSQGTRT